MITILFNNNQLCSLYSQCVYCVYPLYNQKLNGLMVVNYVIINNSHRLCICIDRCDQCGIPVKYQLDKRIYNYMYLYIPIYTYVYLYISKCIKCEYMYLNIIINKYFIYFSYCSFYYDRKKNNVHCSMFTVHCTLYIVHCILYIVYCIMYNVQCRVYTVK